MLLCPDGVHGHVEVLMLRGADQYVIDVRIVQQILVALVDLGDTGDVFGLVAPFVVQVADGCEFKVVLLSDAHHAAHVTLRHTAAANHTHPNLVVSANHGSVAARSPGGTRCGRDERSSRNTHNFIVTAAVRG